MVKKDSKKDKKESKMFSMKYTDERKEKIQKLMEKYNKNTISSLFDELLTIGEKSDRSIYLENKDESLVQLLQLRQEKQNNYFTKLEERLSTIEKDIKEIKHLSKLLPEEKKKEIIKQRENNKTFDKESEDF